MNTDRNGNSSSNKKEGSSIFGKIMRVVAIIFIVGSIIGGVASGNLSVPIMTIIFVVVIWGIVGWIRKKIKQAKKLLS